RSSRPTRRSGASTTPSCCARAYATTWPRAGRAASSGARPSGWPSAAAPEGPREGGFLSGLPGPLERSPLHARGWPHGSVLAAPSAERRAWSFGARREKTLAKTLLLHHDKATREIGRTIEDAKREGGHYRRTRGKAKEDNTARGGKPRSEGKLAEVLV